MIYVKYVSMKENNNLLKLNVDIKYVQSVLNNLKNKNNINYVHFVDKKIGMKIKKITTNIIENDIISHQIIITLSE